MSNVEGRHSDFVIDSSFVIRALSFLMSRAPHAPRNVDPLIKQFVEYLAVERNASPRTLKAYSQALTQCATELKTPWKKCTADQFRDYLFSLMKRKQARTYIRLQFSALRTFYRFLV